MSPPRAFGGAVLVAALALALKVAVSVHSGDQLTAIPVGADRSTLNEATEQSLRTFDLVESRGPDWW